MTEGPLLVKVRREISWNVPAEYHRSEVKAVLMEARAMLPRLFLRTGLPMLLLSVPFLLWLRRYLPPEEHKYIVRAIPMLGAGVVGFFLWLYLMVFVGQYETVRTRLKTGGVVYRSKWWPWKMVAGYRFREIEAFPHLRMLELNMIGRSGNERSRELVFDPAKVDEREISAFMAEVLPGRERVH